MNKSYKLDDFKELLESTDYTNVILGLTMLKASIPFKSMTYEELSEFQTKFRKLRYNYTGISINNSGFNNQLKWELEGKIQVKINNCFQRLEKNERLKLKNEWKKY